MTRATSPSCSPSRLSPWSSTSTPTTWRTLSSGRVVKLPVLGRHQAVNALGAIVVAGQYGVTEAEAASALESFPGVERRLTTTTLDNGVTILDSYAHHPTAIRMDLEVARRIAGEHRVILALQPSGLTRVNLMHTEIALSLAQANDVVLLPVHTRYTHADHDHLLPLIAERQQRVSATVGDLSEAADTLAARALPGDVIVLMGTGDVAELSLPLLAASSSAAS
ncbi:cyanophycin synthetase [Actinocorallia sp. A-T 12471]|nr:cyanophycin synthetase [Actinocorallia sp. A-T 12471]MDX6739200.1 cyanophycin synthetase [Actinocorallia sp. A-T 12471]